MELVQIQRVVRGTYVTYGAIIEATAERYARWLMEITCCLARRAYHNPYRVLDIVWVMFSIIIRVTSSRKYGPPTEGFQCLKQLVSPRTR